MTTGPLKIDHIPKKPIRALVQTSKQLIMGYIHTRPMIRLKDEINAAERFIALTDVTFVGQKQEAPLKFVVLNKDEIVWIAPMDTADQEKGAEG